MADTVKELRDKLGAYLTKPISVGSGEISTQQVVGSSSLSSGGLSGSFVIKDDGEIIIYQGQYQSIFIGIE